MRPYIKRCLKDRLFDIEVYTHRLSSVLRSCHCYQYTYIDVVGRYTILQSKGTKHMCSSRSRSNNFEIGYKINHLGNIYRIVG